MTLCQFSKTLKKNQFFLKNLIDLYLVGHVKVLKASGFQVMPKWHNLTNPEVTADVLMQSADFFEYEINFIAQVYVFHMSELTFWSQRFSNSKWNV